MAAWTNTTLGELFTDKQLQLFESGLDSGALTQAKIWEIIQIDTSKMEGKANPRFMMYALMNQWKVYR